MYSALLVLEDGTKFYGKKIGTNGIVTGEIVFNTSMTGYQEILTDPSYFQQIVVFTYPHIGNVGTNDLDNESIKIQVKALIVHNLSIVTSNFRNTLSLSRYLKKQKIIGISEIDTRKLTKILRERGSKKGCIISGLTLDYHLALRMIKKCPDLIGKDLVKKISTKEKYIWKKGKNSSFLKRRYLNKFLPYHVVVYDYGIKRSILCTLVDYGCRLTVVPATTSAETIINMNPDGIFLSNGPGDPSPCSYAITAIKKLLDINIPIFGICLGYQLIAIASGAKTIKMKFGHHGSNHPVKDIKTNRIIITSQNHNFAVDINTIPSILEVTHISLFDGTCQGIHRIDKLAFGFQGHPEASPGPQDAKFLFEYFVKLIDIYRTRYKSKRNKTCQNVLT